MCTYKGFVCHMTSLLTYFGKRELKLKALNVGVIKGYSFKMWPIIKSSKTQDKLRS
jgi:hypothetical protein